MHSPIYSRSDQFQSPVWEAAAASPRKEKKAQMRHRTNIKQNSVSKRVFRLPVNNITIITHLPYPLPEFGRLDTPVVPPSAAYPKSLGHGLLRMMINDPYIMWRRDSCFSA